MIHNKQHFPEGAAFTLCTPSHNVNNTLMPFPPLFRLQMTKNLGISAVFPVFYS